MFVLLAALLCCLLIGAAHASESVRVDCSHFGGLHRGVGRPTSITTQKQPRLMFIDFKWLCHT